MVAAADDVTYERTGAADGSEFSVGDLVVRAVHTPGHTPTHLSYVVLEDGRPRAAFTGGSMLFGTVGRTDLVGARETDELTRAQFHSVRRLADELPAEVGVHPTHGFGSFCSSTSTSGADASTIGDERRSNLALTSDDEDSFVETLLGGLTAHPCYYAHMAPINRAGPSEVDLSAPEPVDPVEIRRRIAAGEWVVDLRSRTAFASGHLAGTLNLEVGDSFATFLGWTLPWGTPVTLVGDTSDDVAEAQRQMVRIGIDRPAGAAHGGVDTWSDAGDVRSYRLATFDELAGACVRVRRWWSSMSDATTSGRRGTSPVRCTSPSTTWKRPSTGCQMARCGSTAPPATGLRWRRRCSTGVVVPSSPSTTGGRPPPSTTASTSPPTDRGRRQRRGAPLGRADPVHRPRHRAPAIASPTTAHLIRR